MSATTTYDINVRYALQDRVSKPVRGMGTEIQKTERHGRSLMSTMKLVAGAAVVGFGFRAGKKWLIDYNSEMAGAKIQMQTLLSLGTDTSFTSNFERAGDLVKQMTKDAAEGVGTTQDYVEFLGEISKPLLDAGASMKDLTNLTKLGVTAAKTFRIEGAVAGRDIQAMLIGQAKSVDRLPKLLGVNAAAWNKMFRDDGPKKALEELKKVLDTQQMRDAADAYGKSWDGVTSTLEDNLQRALGKVGLPLMKLLSEEVKKMNQYFKDNPEKVKEFIKTLSDGLVSTFKFVKGVVGFLVDNSGTLMALAKAYIGFKVVSGVGGMLGGLGKGAAGAGFAANEASLAGNVMLGFSDKVRLAGGGVTGLSKVVSHATGGIKGLAMAAVNLVGKFNLTMIGLAAVYAGARLLADAIDSRQDARNAALSKRPQGFISAAAGDSQTGPLSDEAVLAYAKDAGLLNGNRINRGRTANAMRGRKGEMSASGVEASIARANAFSRNAGGGDVGFAGSMNGEGVGVSIKRLEALLITKRREESEAFKKNIVLMGKSFLQFMKQGGNMASWNAIAGLSQGGRGSLGGGFDATDPNSVLPGFKKEAKDYKRNGNTYVTISQVKVTTNDPDRFAIDFTGALKSISSKPIGSRIPMPGGRR